MPPDSLATHLDRIFGGSQHWQDFYQEFQQLRMFDDERDHTRLSGSAQIADRYRKRLETVFAKVAPTRRTFRNSTNSPMFELFFGAGNPIGAKRAVPIADHILKYL